jgi:hypothetical protein
MNMAGAERDRSPGPLRWAQARMPKLNGGGSDVDWWAYARAIAVWSALRVLIVGVRRRVSGAEVCELDSHFVVCV